MSEPQTTPEPQPKPLTPAADPPTIPLPENVPFPGELPLPSIPGRPEVPTVPDEIPPPWGPEPSPGRHAPYDLWW